MTSQLLGCTREGQYEVKSEKEKKCRGFDIENFDAFFNMRRKFWEESRDKGLSEKESYKPLPQQYQKQRELSHNKQGKKNVK